MAPRLNLHDPPTRSSSSSDDHQQSSSEESEPEPNPKPSSINPKPASSSEIESELESESESESQQQAQKKQKTTSVSAVSTGACSSGEGSKKKSRNKDDLVLNEMLRFNEVAGLSAFNKDNVIEGLELIDESMRVSMENEWKQIKTAEMEVFVQRTQLVNDQANFILQALKESFEKSSK